MSHPHTLGQAHTCRGRGGTAPKLLTGYAPQYNYQPRDLHKKIRLVNQVCVGTRPSGHSRYNKCGRLCKVVNGRLTNCCRVRKEFESMTECERERYVQAYLRISTNGPYKKEYDKLITMHEKYFITNIHQQSEFLPWHRYVHIHY